VAARTALSAWTPLEPVGYEGAPEQDFDEVFHLVSACFTWFQLSGKKWNEKAGFHLPEEPSDTFQHVQADLSDTKSLKPGLYGLNRDKKVGCSILDAGWGGFFEHSVFSIGHLAFGHPPSSVDAPGDAESCPRSVRSL